MNIEGTYTLQATPSQVWHYLTDQETLSNTVPGVKRIVSTAKDIYDITISMDSAPFTGSHHGQITISEQQYPYQFRLTATSDGKTNLHGVGSIYLHEHNHQTIVEYKGTFTTKAGTHLAPALIKGAIKLYMQQYFQSLAEHLRDHTPTQSAQESDGAASTSIQQPAADIVVIPHLVANEKHPSSNGIISKALYRLRPGAGDPELQARWKQRIRRTSIIAGLIILVWVGTKIPRRQP